MPGLIIQEKYLKMEQISCETTNKKGEPFGLPSKIPVKVLNYHWTNMGMYVSWQ